MGHNRLGGLPGSPAWKQVLALLDQSPDSADLLSQAVVKAADRTFARFANEEALAYSFWLLARIAAASRAPGFLTTLVELGIAVTPETSAIELIGLVSDRLDSVLARMGAPIMVADFSAQAVTAALAETVGRTQPRLFDTTASALQDAVRAYATPARFGDLAQIFFGDFMSRTLTGIVDRALPGHIGGGGGVVTVAESREVLAALDAHSRETASVVRDFAGQWLDARVWDVEGNISRDHARGFVGQAVQKLRSAFKHEVAEG